MNDPDIQMQAKRFFALPYVKLEDIDEYFLELVSDGHLDPRLKPFAQYVEQTWVGTPTRPPRFARELWNVHERYEFKTSFLTYIAQWLNSLKAKGVDNTS